MKPNQKYNNESGFTLVELLTVLLIMTLITTIAVANFRNADKNKRVVIGLDYVVNAIRNAQNYTLAGKNTNNANLSCRVPQYYSITLSYSNPIVLSAYNNCGTTDQIETYTLPTNTNIKTGTLAIDSTVASTSMTLVFYPPFGAVKASLDGSLVYNSFTSASVSVEASDHSISKATTVDGIAGRIGQ